MSAAGENAPISLSDRLLVRLRGGVPDAVAARVFAENRAEIIDLLPEIDTFVLRVPPTALPAVERALGRSPHFESVGRDHIRQIHSSPSDPYLSAQWHLQKIEAPAAWDLVPHDSRVTIAVLDGGAAAVPDLRPVLLPGTNVIEGGNDTTGDGGHGTAVSGIAAGATNNGIGIAGVGWGATILPVKVYTASGTTSCSAISKGILWATDAGARVINMSFGGPGSCGTEWSAVDYAWSKGAVLVASAGNYGSSTATYPAALDRVMAVASTRSSDALSSFSSYGQWLSVAAPGEGIYTTSTSGGYTPFSGTSAAAPVVSGLAALLIAANPALSNEEVRNAIERNADDLGASGFDSTYGWGRVNARRAVSAVAGIIPPPPDTTAPVVQIASPTDGATVSGNTIVSVNAMDEVGVSAVELYVDGVLAGSDASTPFTFAWNTAELVDGDHELTAVGQDAAGNHGTSSTVRTTVRNTQVDTRPPTVSIVSPADQTLVTKAVKIAVAAADDVALARIEVSVDGAKIGEALCAGTSCAASVTWNPKRATKGTHLVTARAVDAAGLSTSTSITLRK